MRTSYFTRQYKCRSILIIIGLVICKCTFSQSEAFLKPPISNLSPDASSLGKYGMYDINEFTGTPNITIPIYDIKEDGVKIPIYLSYDASGFIPNKKASQVGTNWSLTAGGAITRIVKGVPDDKFNPNPDNYDYLLGTDKGYIYGVQHALPTTAQSNIENLSFLPNNMFCPPGAPDAHNSISYEINPDIFSFNFLGHSGTFIMGPDNVPRVIGNGRYRIDMIHLENEDDLAAKISSQQFDPNNDPISSIKITTDDGYIFYFGGKLNALEMSFSFISETSRQVAAKTGVINAWYLTRIDIPNGDHIDFDYGTYSANDIDVFRHIDTQGGGTTASYDAPFFDIRLSYGEEKYKWDNGNGVWGNSGGPVIHKSLTKLVYLESIETKFSSVQFSYSGNDYPTKFYRTDENDDYVNANLHYHSRKLDNITIAHKMPMPWLYDTDATAIPPSLVFHFTYNYYANGSSGGSRLFLTGLTAVNTAATYSFNYSGLNQLPEATTWGLDKWGFYNGHDGNLFLVDLDAPVFGDPAEFEMNFTGVNCYRLSDPSKLTIGMLSRITYPTGGTTDFQFEAHQYRKLLKRKINASTGNSIIPDLITRAQDEYASGLRIHKIINTPGTSITYKYVVDPTDANSPSSGLLTDDGIYRMHASFDNDPARFSERAYDDNVTLSVSIPGPLVCYGTVTQIIGDGSRGFTKTSYTTNETNPDDYYLGISSFYGYTGSTAISSINYLKRLSRYSSRAIERGKVRKKEVFSNSNVLVSSEEYTYNADPNRFATKISAFEPIVQASIPYNICVFYLNAFRIYYYQDEPTQILEKTYSNGTVLTKTTNITYKGMSNPLVDEKTVIQSDGSQIKTKYFYAEDQASVYPFMITKFMVGNVVEEWTYKNNTMIQKQKYVYSDVFGDGTVIKPIKNIITNLSISPGTPEEYINLSYDHQGNIQQRWKANDYKTLYLYDYAKLLPVAEVKNVDDPTQVAYTSFETTEPGGWTYNNIAAVLNDPYVTGYKVFRLNIGATNYNITKSNLNPLNEYIVSLWTNSTSLNMGGFTPVKERVAGGWTYKEYLITGVNTLTISGAGLVDELRLYPKSAFMTTYTYQPLFGITSKCDEDNRVTQYMYGITSGRLVDIRDENKNILKKFCYDYFGQPISCD
ncbi:MAG: hypothetical protein QM737_02645 [Ferruginibacter sp.]